MGKGLYLFLVIMVSSPIILDAQNLEFHGENPAKTRSKLNINPQWKFHLGHPDGAYYQEDFDDSDWATVSIPHTLELTSMDLNGFQDDKYQKTFMRDVGWYRKSVDVSAHPQRKIFLEFEGVHQVTDVWVNGQHVGQHAVGGYTPFHFDISDFVNRGAPNQITILADNRRRDDIPPDPGPMDYIKFGGLYRDVYLVETNPLHVTFNWEAEQAGQFITTPTVDPVNINGTMNIKTVVRNETSQVQATTVICRVVDHQGLVVLKLSQTRSIDPGEDVQFNQIGSIEDDLRLWAIDDPYLYRVHTTVRDEDSIADQIECKTGFRKIEITDRDGVILNGKPIKLIGTNRHQHYGFIGDAMPNSLHYKDVLQLKKLGMNVLRTAHYPHDDAIIEACDELGMLVYEEAPTWMSIGNQTWFDNLEKSARVMVRNHRNHPSIFIWGAGINHRGYVPRIHDAIKQEDPFRFTASQSSRWTSWQTSGLTDIYAQMVYGPYYWSGDEPVLAMEGRRGPVAVNQYLHDPMKLGLISWTAHAYYTFHPSPDPKDRSRGGFTTVFRYPRPEEQLPWYQAELTDFPFLTIHSYWQPGTDQVTIFSNAEKVQLLLNGQVIGVQGPSREDPYKYLKHAPFVFSVPPSARGKLTARGLVDGKIVVSDEVLSPEAPAGIIIDLDTVGRDFTADGSDILVGYAKVVDRNGTVIRHDPMEVSFSIKGPGEIVGDAEGIGSNPMRTQYGVAPILIRAGISPGIIEINAKAKGLKAGSAQVRTTEANYDVLKASTQPIYDLESINVDIGENEQLVQYDWLPWNGTDKQGSTKEFTQLGGFSATIKSLGDESNTRWLGEINVIGKYGYAHGEGVLGTDPAGLLLEFSGLKPGKYQLTTVHHAPRTNSDSMDPNQEKMTTYEIYKIPYAKQIKISISDAGGTAVLSDIEVTEGKDMQTQQFGKAVIYFESDGKNPVKITLEDTQKLKGTWLNSFRLSQWY